MTQKQSEASRRNGSKSRGPSTAAGKRISSRNALTHGLTAAFPIFTNEDCMAFTALGERFRHSWKPVGDAEAVCVDRMVMAVWRERRAWQIEAAEVDHRMDVQQPKIAAEFENGVDEPTRTAYAFRSLFSERSAFNRLQQYETRAVRVYNRALEQLQKLQNRRMIAAEFDPKSADQSAIHERPRQRRQRNNVPKQKICF